MRHTEETSAELTSDDPEADLTESSTSPQRPRHKRLLAAVTLVIAVIAAIALVNIQQNRNAEEDQLAAAQTAFITSQTTATSAATNLATNLATAQQLILDSDGKVDNTTLSSAIQNALAHTPTLSSTELLEAKDVKTLQARTSQIRNDEQQMLELDTALTTASQEVRSAMATWAATTYDSTTTTLNTALATGAEVLLSSENQMYDSQPREALAAEIAAATDARDSAVDLADYVAITAADLALQGHLTTLATLTTDVQNAQAAWAADQIPDTSQEAQDTAKETVDTGKQPPTAGSTRPSPAPTTPAPTSAPSEAPDNGSTWKVEEEEGEFCWLMDDQGNSEAC